MKPRSLLSRLLVFSLVFTAVSCFAFPPGETARASGQPPPKPPNIVMIMGDDVGWFNIGAYHQGMMSGRTPNLDRLASEGMRFTDYYAEASCTAGRSAFITGELPIRTGLSVVGIPGSDVGIPDEAVTLATVLQSMGYAAGQFGKNHLGDWNKYLPTAHGFDEFFGYLYHLDAMEDPCHPTYPPAYALTHGPRNMVHSWATSEVTPGGDHRWGPYGKQKVEDAGQLCPKRMETVDDEILDSAIKWLDKTRQSNKPFFLWLNPTRVHVVTHLSPKYEGMRNSENGWSTSEAAMAQLDDIVGSVMKYLKDNHLEDNTIVGFTTDNGTENFTWPDGGQTPFAGGKGTGMEGGFRAPMILRWPGKIPAGKVENGIVSGLDWFPTFVAAAGNDEIKKQLLLGKQIGDVKYRVHLDGYNQMDLITGKGKSARHEIYYFTGTQFYAVRVDDFKYRFLETPTGWIGTTNQLIEPWITNLRLDPFERTGFIRGGENGSQTHFDWFVYEFWRYQIMQDQMMGLAETFLLYPPMDKGPDGPDVKGQIERVLKLHAPNP